MEDLYEPLMPDVISTNEILCKICYLNADLVSLDSCGHQFCTDCLSKHLETKIRDGIVMRLECPGCGTEISQENVIMLLKPELFSKYQQFLRVKQLELDLYVKWCPMPDCNGFDVASDTNRNLTCNICGHAYCYGCSQPWHKGSCKDSTDFQFKLWKLGNNLKICPRCKNYVQKDGGCPHMNCPRCHFKWCWICGKDYSSSNHTAFKCMMGKNYLELYWGVIFFMLFFPVLVPFLFFVFVVFMYETGEVRTESLHGVFCIFRHKVLVYPVTFLASPVVQFIVIIGCVLGIIFSITFRSARFSFLGLLLGILSASAGIVLASLIIAILMVFAPLAGAFFLVAKIFFCFKNCCMPNQVIEYPRFFI